MVRIVPVAALQEAPFACFEDEEIDAGSSGAQRAFGLTGSATSARGLPTHVVTMPGGNKALPARSVARVVRSLECTGSGTFYFANDALEHRFICWRITKNVLVLREWSLHTSLEGNGLRLQFPAAVVTSGVTATESYDANAVVISVLTHAGSIHRFSFPIVAAKRSTTSPPSTPSIFKQHDHHGANGSSANAIFPRTPSFHTATDIVHSLPTDEAITTALWVNEYNLIVATDTGRIIGVNFGQPSSRDQVPQEFLFTDESMMQWLWNGLVKSSGHRKQRNSHGTSEDLSEDAIVAMAFFPLDSNSLGDESEEEATAPSSGEVDDVCILTLSADFTLRAWSFRTQTCLGKQSIRSLVKTTNPLDTDDELDEDDDVLDDDDSRAFVTQAKLVAIPSSSSGACRLLVHVESNEDYPQQIVLLRGEINKSVGASTELTLDTARVFNIGSSDKQRLKFVDFAVEKGFLLSAWRSSVGDFVYSHVNPMALTGPRVIPGQLVSSVDVQMKKYEREDSELPFLLTDDQGVATLIDNFYVERVLLPGRFSRQSLYKAISESHGGLDAPLRAYFTQIGPQESRYNELLIGVVADKSLSHHQSLLKSGRPHGQPHPNLQRISIWKSLLELCTKHWRSEVAPIGFAALAPPSSEPMLGSPVLLRRNRVSLFFPSAASISSTMLAKPSSSSSASSTTSGTHDVSCTIAAEVLPSFDFFPSHAFQSAVQNEVAAVMVGEDCKVESLVALARQAVRMTMHTTTTTTDDVAPELLFTRSLLRLSQALGHNGSNHLQILQDLIDSLSPANISSGESADDPFAVNSDADDQGGDEDQTMDDTSSTTTATRYFGANETCYAFSQVTARTVDELCAQALRVVLLLAHLVDAQSSLLEFATLKAIERSLLPKAIVVYQRWSQSRWLANQNITSTTEIDLLSAKTSGTLLPPLLQFFLAEANENLNRVGSFQRARAVAEMREFDSSNLSEDPHQLLGSFASGILELVSRPNDLLVAFLQKKREYSILRSMLSCSLNDLSLHEEASMGPLKALIRVKYIRSIGECLAWEGHQAAKSDTNSAVTMAEDYFKQAIRCFNMCLSSYVTQIEATSDGVGEDAYNRAVDNCERFIGTAVRLLKETIPRGYYQLTLSFLWVIASEALELIDSKALQSFVWVNIFKYSVEEQAYYDAHLALMRTVQLSSLAPGFDIGSINSPSSSKKDQDQGEHEAEDLDIARTAVECTSYFVKELCRHGRLDLVCDFQWDALESEVEQQIQWLAANANVVVSKEGTGASVGSIDASVVMYHELVFAFFARRNQPVNAAAAMHALYLRLRLATASSIRSANALRTQRNALLAAMNMLLEVEDDGNRWVVRKLHAEEISANKRVTLSPERLTETGALQIVTYKDMKKDLAVLDGKLRLLHVGLEESVLLATMDASAVVALLVDAALRCTTAGTASGTKSTTAVTMTLSEKKQESLVSLELAVQICAKNALPYDHLTKSLVRFCVANVHSLGVSHLSWELLKTYLRFVDELLQFEIAAKEILTWKVKIVVPEWITSRMSCPRTGNASKLVLLYLTHGLLIEATTAAAEMVPLEIVREGEAAFRKRSNATSASLPWLPYNLFDAVLNADDAALTSTTNSNSFGGFGAANGTGQGDPPLRAAAQSLRGRLVEYFKYVHTLEQARQAAGIARDSYDSL